MTVDKLLHPSWLDRCPEVLSPRTLYVLPSTRNVLSTVLDWREDQLTIVSPQTMGCMDAAEFLSLLRDPAHIEATPCICFSDQLISAVEAPVPVEINGARFYFPGIELIANRSHAYALMFWTGSSFTHVPPASDDASVLSASALYFRACDALGDAWLLRDAQLERSHRRRAELARIRARTLHSVLMHMAPERGMPPTHRRIASRLLDVGRAQDS